MTTTTIINKATYLTEYADKSGSSLIFESEFYDCVSMVDTKKLRKKFALKGRGKVIAILLTTKQDPTFINIANKDITYKWPCFCSDYDDGAFKDGRFYFCNNPLGNVIIVLKE
jgi:hypothetical protein